MTIRTLLDTAIEHEIGSQELYKHLKSMVKDTEAQAFLDDLVKEEKGHEEILRSIIDNKLYDLHASLQEPEFKEEVRSSHSVYVKIHPDSTMEDVLQLALQRENRARIIFERLAEYTMDAEQRLLFEKLAAEESTHKDVIERRFSMRRGEMGYEM